MAKRLDENEIREDIFRWLDDLLRMGDYELSRNRLESYEFQGERIPLLDTSRGIRNPSDFESTLSVMTSAKKTQYLDGRGPEGLIRYAYRDGEGGDNTKLKRALHTEAPLIYFIATRDGFYNAHYPVRVVHDDPVGRYVLLSLSETMRIFGDPMTMGVPERRYVDRIVQQRLHQQLFRARVVQAYADTCAVCRLDVPQLIEAAHIIGDKEELGTPDVSNGLALCALHHTAFDRMLLGITPDYRVEISSSIGYPSRALEYRRSFLELHGQELHVPKAKRDQPRADLLAARFESFRAWSPDRGVELAPEPT